VTPDTIEPVAVPPPSALAACLRPRTIAVIGAGRATGVGASILRNVLAGHQGHVYPINPHADSIAGVRCYATLGDVPVHIDLAVVAVPGASVDQAVDDCIAARVGGIVLITAGFGETGEGGRQREAALRDKVRRAGIRMIGPNCLGLIATDPDAPLNASFGAVMPLPGPVAFASQSGALGLAVLDAAGRAGLGISSFVSVGNAADVSFADLLAYWETDPRVTVILLYAESLAAPRHFAAVARRVSRTKPIVALKSGRSAAGARAASSHTGALAQEDALVDALLRDAGVIRVRTLDALVATATLLAHQPLPSGNRVAVLTNAGGPGILAADACDVTGLTMAHTSAATVEALRQFLPPNAGLGNPIDMIATASADDYRRAMPVLLDDPGVDALVAMFIPLSITDTSSVAAAVAAAANGSTKPVLATFFGTPGVAPVVAPIPCYDVPESSIASLAAAWAYARWRTEPEAPPPGPARIDTTAARALADEARASGAGWMETGAAMRLLAACGITVAPHRFVTSAAGAVAAARDVGYPVVMKGHGPALLHKTESHAVWPNLRDDDAVTRTFDTLAGRADVTSVLVQAMVQGGAEMLAGASRQGAFGHAVLCGSGGILVELLRDTAVRLAPVSARDAAAMVAELRGVRLLRGFRGSPVLDEAALAEMLLRISELVEACPDVVELDVNPVIVTERGAVAVDARIRLG
jgi:acyl-CoA synthetase (NDP forming)